MMGDADFIYRITNTSTNNYKNNTLPTKIVFGSCHKSKYTDAQIWDTIRSEHADAFFWTGDAIYPPVRDLASLEMLQHEYDKLIHNPGYASLLETGIAIFGTYDDHDYGLNDGGSHIPQRIERAALFWNFLQKSAPVPNRQGIYHSVEWESDIVHIRTIFLDTRWFRQNHCLPSVAGKFPLGAGVACMTRWLSAGLLPGFCQQHEPNDAILGTMQWQWLEDQMLHHVSSTTTTTTTTPTQIIFVVSSIQVLTTNPVVESWGHFPKERERLLKLIYRAQQSGTLVVLLSGDVHHGEILGHANHFLEVTSSGLTHTCQKHAYGGLCQPLLNIFHKHRFASTNDPTKTNYFIGRNYGTINLNYSASTVEIKIHDVRNGNVMLTTGPLSFPLLKQNDEYDDRVASVPILMDGHLIPIAWSAFLTLLLIVIGGRILFHRRRAKRTT